MARRRHEIEAAVLEGEIVEAELAADTLAPEPLVRLRAALYETAGGGIVIAFRTEGMVSDGHFVMKPALVKLLAKVSGVKGNPVELLRHATHAEPELPEEAS